MNEVKEEIQKWIDSLQKEKLEIESTIKQADNSLEVAQFKLRIANDALKNLSERERGIFYKSIIKPLEENYNEVSLDYEETKEKNRTELTNINILINKAEEAFDELD